jgi:hypothetical protein
MPDDKCGDNNVESLVFEHRARVNKGVVKYGVTTDRSDLTLLDWVRHAKEEAMDSSVYLRRIETMLASQVFDHADLMLVFEACFHERDRLMTMGVGEPRPQVSIDLGSVERLCADHVALRVKHEEALRLLRKTTNILDDYAHDVGGSPETRAEAEAFLSKSGLKNHTREVPDEPVGCGCGNGVPRGCPVDRGADDRPAGPVAGEQAAGPGDLPPPDGHE